jgi:hypothetical protein
VATSLLLGPTYNIWLIEIIVHRFAAEQVTARWVIDLRLGEHFIVADFLLRVRPIKTWLTRKDIYHLGIKEITNSYCPHC